MEYKGIELFHLGWELGLAVVALAVRAKLQRVNGRVLRPNDGKIIRHCSELVVNLRNPMKENEKDRMVSVCL